MSTAISSQVRKLTALLMFRTSIIRHCVPAHSIKPNRRTCSETFPKLLLDTTQTFLPFTSLRNGHTLTQSVLRCEMRYWIHEEAGKRSGMYRKHLTSMSKDGVEDGKTGESKPPEETQDKGHTVHKDHSKLRAAQQFQSMHQMLDGAQVHTPTKDFDFSSIPQHTEVLTEGQDHRKSSLRLKQDPREMSVFLFPGQGTQFVGMGRRLLKYPNVKKMFSVASDILEYDLLDLCLNSTKEELNRTVHCQPAIVVCSLAAVEKLKEEQPKAVENCVTAAGFSVGEFSALVFAGALTFEDAIQLIKVRAESMQRSSELVPSGMLSVIGRSGTRFKMMCREATDSCILKGIKDPMCMIASHLFPDAKVVAGNTEALDYIQEMSHRYSLRMTRRIPVSGAFHSPFMAPAKDAFTSAVDSVPMDTPVIAVHSNINGKRYRHPKHIRTLLKRQLLEPIHWEQTMHEVYQRSKGDAFPTTYEVGPGKQLGGFLEKNNLKAFHSYVKVDV